MSNTNGYKFCVNLIDDCVKMGLWSKSLVMNSNFIYVTRDIRNSIWSMQRSLINNWVVNIS